MYIEIVTTPNEALKESGFGALKACESVLTTIQKMGHSARLNICESKEHLDEVVRRKPNLVVLAVKYIPLENKADIWLSDYFSQYGINFTGSLREVLKFDSNKVLAKTRLTDKGVATANYFMAIPGEYKTENELPLTFPLFLKPLDAANGNGIDDSSFVTNFIEYEKKITSLYRIFNQPILVEEYLDGREYTVAVIKIPHEKLIVSAVEVIPPASSNGLRILGEQAKKDDSEKLIKIDDDKVKKQVMELAINAFRTLGARDFGRIDIKSNKNGKCFFMEANLIPGMTFGSSYFPKACNIAHTLSYDKVIELLIAGGLARRNSNFPPNSYPDSDGKFVAAVKNIRL